LALPKWCSGADHASIAFNLHYIQRETDGDV
jgi:hypothetical protein